MPFAQGFTKGHIDTEEINMIWLLDPRIFNFTIMALYALAVMRWAYEGNWWNAFYWFAALQLVAVITWGMKS